MRPIEVLTSVSDVDPEEWERLAGGRTLASRNWLRFFAESSLLAQETPCFVARDADGVVAAAPCFVQGSTRAGVGVNGHVFGRFAPAFEMFPASLVPALVCGPTMGLRPPVLVRRGLTGPARGRWVREVVEAMVEEARHNGWAMCFRNVLDTDAELVAALRDLGLAEGVELPSTVLELPFDSFSDYRRWLRRRHPATAKNVGSQINRAVRAGVRFEERQDPGSREAELQELADRHYRRLNNDKALPFRTGFLGRLSRRLGDACAISVAWHGERPIGVGVIVQDAEERSLLIVGIDRPQVPRAYTYFNLNYNEPIKHAIEAGQKRVFGGKMVYDVKLHRGFELVPARLFVRGRSPLQDAFLRRAMRWQARVVRGKVAAAAGDVGR